MRLNSNVKPMTACYFLIYAFMSFIVVWIFKINNSFHMNQIFYFHSLMISFSLLFYLNLMSLGGLPPFLGFFPKWMIVKTGINNIAPIILILISSSIMTLYFYLRMTYTAMMIMYCKPLFTLFPMKTPSSLKIFILASLLVLPLMVTLY